MDLAKLKVDYEIAVRILRRERAMRVRVFRGKHNESAKLAEIDTVLAILQEWKDVLKADLPQQGRLLENEERVSYD